MDITIKKTVLIIDDDESEVMITKRVLSKVAPETGTAAVYSGEAGLALLRSANPLPVLILLDLKMPGLSGIDVLLQIRADERLSHLPVIIVTNSTLESDRQKSIDSGADGYIHKAFEVELFSRDIKSILEHWLKD